MNDIGFGILCFGDKYYHQGAHVKQQKIMGYGYECYILTDQPSVFNYNSKFYDTELQSYHDKMLIPKHILAKHDICILIDADSEIKDYSFLETLKDYKFNPGISYPDILLNHPEQKKFVKELSMSTPEWKPYKKYISSILPDYGELELIWEYFLVINWEESYLKNFYHHYERLKVAKEYGELDSSEVVGAGEGISIAIASKLSGTPCERDYYLYDIIKDKINNRSRRFMRDDS